MTCPTEWSINSNSYILSSFFQSYNNISLGLSVWLKNDSYVKYILLYHAYMISKQFICRLQGFCYDFEVAPHFWKSAHPKWSKVDQNGLKLYKMVQISHLLPIKMTDMTGSN